MTDRMPAAPEIVCVECGPLLGGRKYLHGAALYEDLEWHRRASTAKLQSILRGEQ